MRENDIYMEKHALIKLRDTYYDKTNDLAMPSVRLITTFKDNFNLYFLNEMLRSKNEVWEHCRSFGMLQHDLVCYVFYHICLQVEKLHRVGIIHRDLKPENMFFSGSDLRSVKLIDLGSADDLLVP